MTSFKKIRRIIILGSLLVACILYAMSLRKPLFQNVSYSTVLFDDAGNLLSATISDTEQWYFEPSGVLSEKYKTALITYEDKRFYKHIGIDFKAIARAIRLNLKHKKIVSGGSTISMQTIRLSKGNPPRTVWHKIIEIILATRLEIKHSKEEILQYYAAHAPFGGNVIGVDAACWRYFNKSPEKLSWSEAALLAVLPNSPGLIHTERNRKTLKKKRDRLLYRLFTYGKIDETTYESALLESIPRRPKKLPHLADHFLHFAKAQTGKAQIHSTIRSEIQKKCLQIAQTESRKLKTNYIENLAILVLDIETQTVLAYVGNEDRSNKAYYNDMVQAQRSTGSVLKPFLYASALEEGLISEGSFLPDYPFSIDGFTTKNYSGEHTGLIKANIALQKSLNIPFSYLLQQYGVEKFLHLTKELGLRGINKSSSHYGIPLILGGAESSLWDLTHAYASMGSILNTYLKQNGYYIKHPVYTSCLTKDCKQIEQDLTLSSSLFKAEHIWLTFENLKEVNRPSQEGEWKQFSSSIPVAWKTGTSNGFKDAWAIGVNGKYAIGVWVGNSNGEGRPGIVGSQVAAPIFFRVLHSLDGHKTFEIPIDDLTRIPTCSISGELANSACPIDSTYISSSSRYLTTCTYHQYILVDKTGSFKVKKSCYSANKEQKVEFSIPPHIAYYYKQKNMYTAPLPAHPSCVSLQQNEKVNIIYPQDDVQIYQPKVGQEERNKFVLKAYHLNEDARLMWHLDERFLGSTQKIHEMSVLLDEGIHTLLVIDEYGNKDETSFEILQ